MHVPKFQDPDGRTRDGDPKLGYSFLDILHTMAYMGVSENSVPLNPMANDHYPY